MPELLCVCYLGPYICYIGALIGFNVRAVHSHLVVCFEEDNSKALNFLCAYLSLHIGVFEKFCNIFGCMCTPLNMI